MAATGPELGEIGIHGVYLAFVNNYDCARGGEIAREMNLLAAEGGASRAERRGFRARESDMDRQNLRELRMQSAEEVGIYAKPQPLFAKFTKLQTSIAKLFEGYVGV